MLIDELSTQNIDAIRILAVISVVISALFAIGKFIRHITQAIRRLGHALDILIGVPQIGEIPERPGIIARLAKIEAEVRPNHGTSMRDTVDDIKTTSARVDCTVLRMEERMRAQYEEFKLHLHKYHGVDDSANDADASS